MKTGMLALYKRKQPLSTYTSKAIPSSQSTRYAIVECGPPKIRNTRGNYNNGFIY